MPHDTNPDSDGTAPKDSQRNRQFVGLLAEYDSVLAQEYLQENGWREDVCESLKPDVKTTIASTLQENWSRKFMERNKEMFVGYLARLYFCPDKETYGEEVKTVKFEDSKRFLLPPQYQAYEEVESWDEEKFADEDTRKSEVEEMVEELKEEPWGGEDPRREVAWVFSERYEEEHL